MKGFQMVDSERHVGRPRKHDAEYFPHFCNPNRILEIIEDKYGNDGYGFYYRLRELLGKTPKHGYDANNTLKYDYLLSKTGVDSDFADEIIALLCDFGELDGDLWRDKKLLWWQNFVDSLKVLYKKRKNELPKKADFIISVLIEEENQGTEIHKVN